MATDSTFHSYSWLKEISKNDNLDHTLPQLPQQKDFPWEHFSLSLAKLFNLPSIKIEGTMWKKKAAEAFISSLGEEAYLVTCRLPNITGEAYLGIAKETLKQITFASLQCKTENSIYDADTFLNSFFYFLSLNIADLLVQEEFFCSLHPQLDFSSKMPEEAGLLQEITFTIDTHHFSSMLFISETLQKSWITFFSEQEYKKKTANIASMLMLNLGVEIGKVTLSQEEWNTLNLGDLLLLKESFISFPKLEGYAQLTASGKPVVVGKWKGDNQLTIEKISGIS